MEAVVEGRCRLPKNERLQKGIQFGRVYEHGRKVVGRLFVLHVLDEAPALPGSVSASRAIGVVTSRKVGGAVQRNRARRLLREAYRLNKTKLRTNLQIVMIARIAINGKQLADVQAEFLRLCQAAGILNPT